MKINFAPHDKIYCHVEQLHHAKQLLRTTKSLQMTNLQSVLPFRDSRCFDLKSAL